MMKVGFLDGFIGIFADCFWWLLYTRFGQWVSRKVTGGWCFVKKDDPRFVVTADGGTIYYTGDPSVAPDKGISRQREKWKTWIIFLMPRMAYDTFFVVIDIHTGRRMIYMRTLRHVDHVDNVMVAIRAGHEGGTIRIAMRWDNTSVGEKCEMANAPCLQLKAIGRWNEDGRWPFADCDKSSVNFI